MTAALMRQPFCGICSLFRTHHSHVPRIPSVFMSTNRFWEADKKSGYDTKIQVPTKKLIKESLGNLGTEFGKFREEMKIKFRGDPILDIEPGDYEVLWKFDNRKLLDDWIVTCDSDHNEGKSNGEIILSRSKTALFRGNIKTEVPKDGIIKNAGYVNIRSPKNIKSFQRNVPYDWSTYTHLLMCVRGDGRPYQVIIHMDRYFDIQWNDQYSYSLFTRGGPYWQVAKIPFSKFYLNGKGRIQDKQETLMNQLQSISFLGITSADGCPGPFQLEIDYIGVIYDASHTERFAYEMYEVSPSVHC